ncbi:hypothetical protein BX666DRAFT_1865001 [Dichotomocladium elegans]|nr:hypothetical protein BX666DRAFT_1865001 [Dichotomocladium elegans]
MRKFTTLLLRAACYSSLEEVDADKLRQMFKILENSLIRAMDVDVIQIFEELREKKEKDLSMVVRLLEIISNGLETAAMIYDIIAACSTDVKYLPENIVTTCLQLIRNHLETTIYPLIDLNGFEEDTAMNNGIRIFLMYVESIAPARRYLSRLLPLITHFLHRASTLLLANEIDDHGVIVLSYISLGVFFHDYVDDNHTCLVTIKSGDNVINPYEQAKMGSMEVLRVMFNKFPHHRKWILSEVLTSLNALTSMDRSEKRYRLRDNTKIHVMSALFMQLVQCCAVSGDIEDQKQWMRKWKLKYQKARNDGDVAQIRSLDEKLVQQSVGYWKSATEAASQSAAYLLDFLITKQVY